MHFYRLFDLFMSRPTCTAERREERRGWKVPSNEVPQRQVLVFDKDFVLEEHSMDETKMYIHGALGQDHLYFTVYVHT